MLLVVQLQAVCQEACQVVLVQLQVLLEAVIQVVHVLKK